MPKHFLRTALLWSSLLFLVGCFIYSGKVLVQATSPLLESINHLEKGEKLLIQDPEAASQEFETASTTLYDTVTNLRQSSDATKFVSVLPPFRWQIRLIKASYSLSQAGSMASELASTAPQLPKNQRDINALVSSTNKEYSTWYHNHEETITKIQQQLALADTEMKAVPPWIALHRYSTLKHAQDLVAKASFGLKNAQTVITELEAVFGSNDSKTRTILVVFQNDAELRTTGGFPGSYALLTAKDGRLQGYTFGTNVFKIDKAFRAKTLIRPPEPLLTITDYYSFRDSNTEHGFLQQSAADMADMYTKETGTQVDGMILLDASLLEDIVRVTGPLKLPATTGSPMVTAENIRVSLTNEVEKDYFTKAANKQENEPKQVLNDLIPVLLDKLQNTPGSFNKLVPVLQDAVARKSLQVWLPNPESARTLLGLFPEDKAVQGQHWIKVVNNNIGGMKSSVYIEQIVKLEQTSDPIKKRLVNTLTITRHHAGSGTWPDGPNRNYTEVYLPKEAEISSVPAGIGGYSSLTPDQQKATGTIGFDWNKPAQETTPEWKRIGFWMSTAVGDTSVQTITYTLPLTSDFQNRLTYFKQAGSSHEKLIVPAFRLDQAVTSNITAIK